MADDEDERKRLLWPTWSTRHNGPSYDSLDDAAKAVWRKTRNQRSDMDAYVSWVHDLANAIHRGLVTSDEAAEAIEREGET